VTGRLWAAIGGIAAHAVLCCVLIAGGADSWAAVTLIAAAMIVALVLIFRTIPTRRSTP